MKVGDRIDTPYGNGELLAYKEIGGTYEVQLPFGKLYAKRASIGSPESDTITKAESRKSSMEINEAYEALEKMRRLNLEVTCQDYGISNVDHNRCVTCLFTEEIEDMKTRPRFPNIRKLMNETRKLKPKASCSPCLICGAPVCARHTSSTFRAEKVNVCLECEKLFNIEYVVECLIMNKKDRRQRVDHMIDLYDRTVLLLKYSSKYIDELAAKLDEAMARQNKIGVGGSTAGIVSGALGIAAAATILTPAGPPLLVASLLFGGSATAVQTGTEVKNRYFSEPHQLAANIIALHAMQKNILKVADTLRDAVAMDQVLMDRFKEERESAAPLPEKVVEAYEQHRGGFLAGLTAGRLGMAGLEAGQMASAAEASAVSARNARFFSRTSSNLLRTARFARFAGGAISAVTLVLEARCMNDTLKNIREGNPCDRAQSLRTIQSELPELPSTAALDRECETYLQVMNKRERQMTEQEAVRLLIEAAQAQAESEREIQNDLGAGSLIVEGEETPPANSVLPFESNKKARTSSKMSASLLERIQLFKDRQSEMVFSDPVSIDEAPADLLG